MSHNRKNRTLTLIAGASAGAGCMYLLDPDRGQRRRALVRDTMVRAARATGEALEGTWRDARTGAEGRTGPAWRRIELMHAPSSPSAIMAIGCLGAGLTWVGATRRSVPGKAVLLLGAALLARTLTSLDWAGLTGTKAERRGIDIRKTVKVAASAERVFAFLSNYENFPKLMKRIREVRRSGNDRSRWTLAGPAGANISWDTILTEYVPNQVLAWETEPGSLIDHSGRIRFTDNGDGTTAVQVQMTYNPLAGAFAHSLAALLGTDPETLLDDELARMQTVLESGMTPHAQHEKTGAAEQAKA